MNKCISIPESAEALGRDDLMQINGGSILAGVLIAWGTYLLNHEEQFVDGLVEGFNELKDTIIN